MTANITPTVPQTRTAIPQSASSILASPPLRYDPFDPETVRDPYPVYARLRAEDPIHRIEGMGAWAVSRHRDVLEVLRDPALYSSSPVRDIARLGMASAGNGGLTGEMLLGTDPPVHTRLRKIVNRGFTRGRIAEREARVWEVAESLVDEFATRGECDIVRDLANPLPMTIIAEILGIDPERRAEFKRFSDAILLAITGRPSPEDAAGMGRIIEELDPYFDEIVEARRREPRNDVVSALVNAADDEDQEVMTSEEVGNLIVLLLVAGNETTTNLIANSVLALLRNPSALEAVQWDPSLVPNLVEETLRWDCPLKLTLRRATRDTCLGGTPIAKGDLVLPLIGSANRDELVFPDPERFDLHRAENNHLAFGVGTHFCLGASLARMEARIALQCLLSRVRRLEAIETALEWTPSLLVRGPQSLQISFETT